MRSSDIADVPGVVFPWKHSPRLGLTCGEFIRGSSQDQCLLGKGSRQDRTEGDPGLHAVLTKPRPVKSSGAETPSKPFHIGVRDKSLDASCPGRGKQLRHMLRTGEG